MYGRMWKETREVTTIEQWWIETYHLIVMTAIAYAALC